MKLIKYLFWVLLLIGSLVFLVKFNELNQFDGNPLEIKIPFLVDIPAYEHGFKVWLVLVMTLTLGVVIGFLLALSISVFLSYSIYYIMICLAFWFGEVRAIVVAYNISMTIVSGQYIPIRLFPEHIINIIEFTPLLYLVDFPVSIATGRIP